MDFDRWAEESMREYGLSPDVGVALCKIAFSNPYAKNGMELARHKDNKADAYAEALITLCQAYAALMKTATELCQGLGPISFPKE